MVDSKGFPKELSTLLLGKIRLTEDDARDYFDVSETSLNGKPFWALTLKSYHRGYLETGVKNAMTKLVQETDGRYLAEPLTFYIPTGREAEAPPESDAKANSTLTKEPPPVQTSGKNHYDLKLSAQLLPMLKVARPLIYDGKGVIIDGIHRYHQVDKNWPSVTVPIENENQRKIARFVLNFCRRNVTDKEKRDFLVALAVETGWSPKEMDEHLPMSYSWIMKYLPEEYKHKDFVELGAKGGVASVASRREAKGISQEIRFVPCEKCGVSISEPVDVEGHKFCDKHGKEALEHPEILKTLPKPSLSPKKIEEKIYKPPIERYEDRERKRHPEVSQMEEYLRVAFTEKHVPFETDQKYCVLSVKPDFVFRQANLAVFIDGEYVHKNRRSRDAYLRDLFVKRHHMRVLELTFPDNTQKSKDEILQKVLDEVNG